MKAVIMKKLFFVLVFALILIINSNVFANSSKFGFLADSSQNQNSLRFFYAQNQSVSDTSNSKYLQNKNLRLKDSNKALFYSIFPGFFLHGTGHLYAGKPRTALLLFTTEVFGVLLLVRAAGLENSSNKEKTAENSALVGVIGSMLFFGSWFYDLIGSPLEVKKRNEELLKSGKIDIEFEIKESLYCLKLVKKF